jgi:hypothetical protein
LNDSTNALKSGSSCIVATSEDSAPQHFDRCDPLGDRSGQPEVEVIVGLI